MIMRFKSQNRMAVWSEDSKSLTCSDLAFVGFVQRAVQAKELVAVDYWAPVTASLDTPWGAYLTVGWCWGMWFHDVPAVDPVPDAPGGYEPEGPAE